MPSFNEHLVVSVPVEMGPRNIAKVVYLVYKSMQFSSFPPHHAILLTSTDRINYVKALWEEVRILSPAHRHFDQTVLDIDTAREIVIWAKTPYHNERVALISFHTAGIPAQNAMLKILEEPPLNTRFILITSNKSALIPTILSRVHIMESLSPQNTLSKDAETFLQTPHEMRMTLPFIINLLDKTDESDRKDREAVRGFLLSLAQTLSDKKPDSPHIQQILKTASYASDPSASGKALIEYLSLLLPQTKL